MKAGQRRTRYAHAEGHTDVCYSDDGKYIFTCGSDSDVRIWTDIDDDDPASHCAGGTALGVIFKNDRVYVGTDNNIVQVYTFPDISVDGRPLRFSAPVTSLDVSSNGKILAASSCDMEVQVIDLETKKITKLSGHSAPVLSISLDPKLKFLASSSCDSSIKIWDINSGQAVKTFENLIPRGNDFFTAICLGKPAWHPKNGSYLAIVDENKVGVYSRNDWAFQFHLKSNNIQKCISIVRFSPKGNYLCSATVAGEIIVWNFTNHDVIHYSDHNDKTAISSIAWHPNDKEIAFCDRTGHFGVLKVKETEGKSDVSGNASQKLASNKVTKESDDYNENEISIDEIKASTGWLSPSKMFERDVDGDEDDSRSEKSCRDRFPVVDMQPSFQPSSTPTHFEHRYMVWNSIGIARCFNSDRENSIDVEFHDTLFHHSLHMNNYEGYTLAALSSRVLVLASSSTNETLSKLTCILLNSWDSMKEWSLVMPKNENICAIAASGNWVCCATDSNQLRVYTSTGTQKQVISIPGPVVCMSGHDQFLMVVYHSGIGLPECQNLGYMLLEVSDLAVRAVVPCQPVPLFPKSKLKWVGFSDEGTPCLYDSEGILRMTRDYVHWMVSCDTRTQNKSESDHYFIVGVRESAQNVQCILCKGSFYPMTTPRPTVIEIPLKLPLCEADSEKTALEDVFWRNLFGLPVLAELSHVNDEYKTEFTNAEKLLKQTVIKLFANACRADADMRAVDVAGLMSEKPLEIAVKYAAKVGKVYLTEKLNNLIPKDWNVIYSENDQKSSCDPVPDNSDEVRGGEIKNTFSFKRSRKEQKDMFEDSQPSQSPEKEANTVTRNQENEPEFVNPFKIREPEDDGPKGLKFFDSLKPSDLKGFKRNSLNGDTTGVNQNENKGKNSNSKKETFADWFDRRKSSLESQFPGLSSADLAKEGLKMYRDEKNLPKKKIRPNAAMEDELEEKKRKMNGSAESEDNRSSAAKKLKKFDFL